MLKKSYGHLSAKNGAKQTFLKYNILLIFAFFSDLKMPPRKKNRFLENIVGAQAMVVIKTKKYGDSFMK